MKKEIIDKKDNNINVDVKELKAEGKVRRKQKQWDMNTNKAKKRRNKKEIRPNNELNKNNEKMC